MENLLDPIKIKTLDQLFSTPNERWSFIQLWVINRTHSILLPCWKLCSDLSGCAPVADATVGLLWSIKLNSRTVLAICSIESHTHTHIPEALWQPDNSCPHRDPGKRHRKANSSVSFWTLMDIMVTVPQRWRWELSAYENRIIKLHSQIWLISGAVAFLQAERNKKNGKQRNSVLPSLCVWVMVILQAKRLLLGICTVYWEISQGYKLKGWL